ncbi:MAG: class I SAM-dependent methyltransferase [Candidatus Sulfotelmatobacter sp.]
MSADFICDAESLPFSDESFDAVICECAFLHFPG